MGQHPLVLEVLARDENPPVVAHMYDCPPAACLTAEGTVPAPADVRAGHSQSAVRDDADIETVVPQLRAPLLVEPLDVDGRAAREETQKGAFGHHSTLPARRRRGNQRSDHRGAGAWRARPERAGRDRSRSRGDRPQASARHSCARSAWDRGRVMNMAKIEDLVDQLSAMTVLDVVQLVKALEARWGVNAAPVAVAGPAIAARPAPVNEDEGTYEFHVE